MEFWKTILRTPDYEISSLGRVRNATTHRILKARLRKNGYMEIALRDETKKQHHLRISRLIGLTFLGGPPFPGAIVAHKDGTRTNDTVCNLYWTTQKQNHADREAHGRAPKGSRNGSAVLDEASVQQIRQLLAEGARQSALADIFGVCGSTINHIKTRKSWSHI